MPHTTEALQDRISMLFLASYPFWTVARWGIGFPVLSGLRSHHRCDGDRCAVLSAVEAKGFQPSSAGALRVSQAFQPTRHVCWRCQPPLCLGRPHHVAPGEVLQHSADLQNLGISLSVFQPMVNALALAGRCSVPMLLMGMGAKLDGIFVETMAGTGPRHRQHKGLYNTACRLRARLMRSTTSQVRVPAPVARLKNKVKIANSQGHRVRRQKTQALGCHT